MSTSNTIQLGQHKRRRWCPHLRNTRRRTTRLGRRQPALSECFEPPRHLFVVAGLFWLRTASSSSASSKPTPGYVSLLNDKPKAIAVLTKRLQQKNPKADEETYDYIATSFSFPTRIAQQGVRNTLEMVAQRNPAAKVDMNMSKYVDESTLDELEKEGFFKRITGK